jgi:hypothetical protein
MDKDTLVKFGMSVGAVVVGVAIFQMIVAPMLARRTAAAG